MSRLLIGLQFAEELPHITREELDQLVICLQTQLPSVFAQLDAANVFTLNQQIAKVRPDLQLLYTGGTARMRLSQESTAAGTFSNNLSFDGTNWNLDDVTQNGSAVHLTLGHIYFFSATAGANPRTLTQVALISSSGVFTPTVAMAKSALPASIAYEDEANVFTFGQEISSITPAILFTETDRGADLKKWYFYAETEVFRITTLNDAGAGLVQTLTIDRAGGVNVTGTLGLLNGQLNFPATQNPSANANTLDDYEEGSWTPTLGGTTSESGQTYAGQSGAYVKIGRKVFVTGTMIMSAKGTITGGACIKGLPFVVNIQGYGAGSVGYFANMTTAITGLYLLTADGFSFIQLFYTAAAAVTMTQAVQGSLSNTFDIRFACTYLTTD